MLKDNIKNYDSPEYKELRAKKEECKDVIEPEFFKDVYGKYDNEEDLLRGELGDCNAVIDLLENH